jgi:Uncharacterized protein conserved in bacteria (DUF2188)
MSEVLGGRKPVLVRDQKQHKYVKHTEQEDEMTKATYMVVEHDGGWAYELGGAFSEPFPTKEAAHAAAERAAREQRVPGASEEIEFEDKSGKWHKEFSRGSDRPDTEVD